MAIIRGSTTNQQSIKSGWVSAETHTITLVNNCGTGNPVLKTNGNTLKSGNGDYTSNAAIVAAISYLDTGCGANGEGCLLVETTMQNPSTAGSGSSTDLSLIPPHAFNRKATFAYKNGCSDSLSCDSGSCDTAFHVDTDTYVQRACQVNDAGLTITYC
ncbi:hypothetical protein PLICRDRAFT_561358 [Plicaturopsis crispa FD-325 SS-3]|nr:hypothetical protein PLICRDRAFT_561358 [Plicaturopsis crispa FD-325 SS-3]